MNTNKIVERYFFFGLLLATLVFTFLIFRPFLIVLVLGISFSMVLYPIYAWLTKRRLPDWLAAMVTILIFLIVLGGPLLGIGALVFNQSQDIYNNLVVNEKIPGPFLSSIESSIDNMLPPGLSLDLEQKTSEFISFVTENIATIFSSTLSVIFSFVIMILSIFFFLKDGPKWRKEIISLSPLPDHDDEKIIFKLSQTVNGVIKGYLLIALLQGLFMGVGLWIFNIPNPALWGVIASLGALVPMVGTAIVSIPAIIFLLVTGSTASALGLLAWAIVVVGLVDNFLNPIIVSGKTNIPPLFILFSVLGGISLLGPVGILIGPLSVSLLYTLISIYREEFN